MARSFGALLLACAACASAAGPSVTAAPSRTMAPIEDDARDARESDDAAAQRRARTCVPRLFREQALVLPATVVAKGTLTYGLSLADESGDPPQQLWLALELESGNFAFAKPAPEPERAVVVPKDDLFRASERELSICNGQQCRPLVGPKQLGKKERFRLTESSTIDYSTSADRKRMALVVEEDGPHEEPPARIETWDVDKRRLLKTFRVTTNRHGDAIWGFRFVGSSLLVMQCDQGPSCSGRLFDPATGKLRLTLDVDLYGAEVIELSSGEWALVDGWLRSIAVLDRTGTQLLRAIRLREGGEPESGGLIVRVGGERVAAVYAGGDVLVANLGSGTVKSFSPETCDP